MGLARWVFKQNQLLRSCKSSKYQMAIRGDRFSGSSNILKIAPFDTLLEKGKRKGVEICATLPIWGGLLPVDAILPPGSFSTATRSWTHRCPSTDASVPSNVARARDCLSLSCAIASDELNKVPRETMHCAADKSKNLFLFFFSFSSLHSLVVTFSHVSIGMSQISKGQKASRAMTPGNVTAPLLSEGSEQV